MYKNTLILLFSDGNRFEIDLLVSENLVFQSGVIPYFAIVVNLFLVHYQIVNL